MSVVTTYTGRATCLVEGGTGRPDEGVGGCIVHRVNGVGCGSRIRGRPMWRHGYESIRCICIFLEMLFNLF